MSDIETLVDHASAAGILRVYSSGSVPAKPEYPYAVLSTSRMAPDIRTLDGSGNDPRRFVAQMFGRNHESVSDLGDLMLAAFDAAFLDLPGQPQCRNEVNTTPYRDPDDRGVLNVTQTYSYL